MDSLSDSDLDFEMPDVYEEKAQSKSLGRATERDELAEELAELQDVSYQLKKLHATPSPKKSSRKPPSSTKKRARPKWEDESEEESDFDFIEMERDEVKSSKARRSRKTEAGKAPSTKKAAAKKTKKKIDYAPIEYLEDDLDEYAEFIRAPAEPERAKTKKKEVSTVTDPAESNPEVPVLSFLHPFHIDQLL